MRTICLVVLASLGMVVSPVCGAPDVWVRRTAECSEKPVFEPFRIQTISRFANRLIALAVYSDYRSPHLSIKLDGIVSADCHFWPKVIAQVSNNLERGWEGIGELESAGQPGTLIIQARNPNATLYVSLDRFESYIGKRRFGRLLLGNGEYACVELANLKEPDESKGSSWSRELLLDDAANHLGDQSPFALGLVSKEGGQLKGTAAYFELKDTSETSIEGVKSTDGHFWPEVTAQVSNDVSGPWRTVGNKSNHEGTATAIRIRAHDSKTRFDVDLNIFLECVERFRYGRLVLNNGDAALVELREILP